MFFIIVLTAAVIILIVLLTVKVHAKASFHHNRIKAAVTWLGIPFFKKEFVFRRDEKKLFTLYAIQKKGEKLKLSLDDLIRLSTPKKEKKTNAKEALNYLHSKVSYDLKIKFVIGTGDALLTALSCGLLQSVIGALYALRENKKIKLNSTVVPDFSKQTLCFDADCIIKASPVHIMIGYMIYKKMIRR